MLDIGKRNILQVDREIENGLILTDGSGAEILLPRRYVQPHFKQCDDVDVFIYSDSEDRLVAVTDHPKVMVGEFACLTVVSISSHGAFLDWGLPKDLFVPWREQSIRMEEGRRYVVYVYVDEETTRIAASSRLPLFLNNVSPKYKIGDQVSILVFGQTDLGYKVIINNLHEGLIFKNEVFSKISVGDTSKAFIKNIREDGKIDVSLYKQGYTKVGDATDVIMGALRQDGFIEATDKSDAELINQLFGMSKKTFKQAVGALYKQRLISIEEKGIRLLNDTL